MIFSNLKSYIGENINGIPEGNGFGVNYKGDKYQGIWKKGLPHFEGHLTLSSGIEYIGNFQYGMASKKGRAIDSEVEVKSDYWEEGIIKDEELFTAQFKNGMIIFGKFSLSLYDNDRYNKLTNNLKVDQDLKALIRVERAKITYPNGTIIDGEFSYGLIPKNKYSKEPIQVIGFDNIDRIFIRSQEESQKYLNYSKKIQIGDTIEYFFKDKGCSVIFKKFLPLYNLNSVTSDSCLFYKNENGKIFIRDQYRNRIEQFKTLSNILVQNVYSPKRTIRLTSKNGATISGVLLPSNNIKGEIKYKNDKKMEGVFDSHSYLPIEGKGTYQGFEEILEFSKEGKWIESNNSQYKITKSNGDIIKGKFDSEGRMISGKITLLNRERKINILRDRPIDFIGRFEPLNDDPLCYLGKFVGGIFMGRIINQENNNIYYVRNNNEIQYRTDQNGVYHELKSKKVSQNHEFIEKIQILSNYHIQLIENSLSTLYAEKGVGQYKRRDTTINEIIDSYFKRNIYKYQEGPGMNKQQCVETFKNGDLTFTCFKIRLVPIIPNAVRNYREEIELCEALKFYKLSLRKNGKFSKDFIHKSTEYLSQ